MYGQSGYFMQNYNPYAVQGVPDMLAQAKMPYQQPVIGAPKNDMIWVLNENEAISYLVAPNNSVVLWDKNNPTIYVKSVNAQGVPSMRVLDFVERTDKANNEPVGHVCRCGDKYATKEQFEALKHDFEALEAKYDAFNKKEKTGKAQKEEAVDNG